MPSADLDSANAVLDLPLGRIEARVAECREQAARDLRAARDAITEAAAKSREYTMELRRAIQGTAVEDEVLLGQGSRDMSEIMGDYLRRVDRATAVQEKAAQRALDDSSGILELLKQLQKVSRSSKLVTLNAAAWAERFEANGPLALLVDQMGVLNRDINKETRSIAQAATELLSVLPSLVDRITRLRSVSLQFITDGTSQAAEVARAVTLLRERAQSVGQNGDRRAVEVTQAAEEASRRLDCNTIFERCFEQLNGVLSRVAAGEWRGNGGEGVKP
jgi:predicted DCC family thiol-disulfide oxidoreductase YuxK